MAGARRHFGGLAAEEIAARAYRARGGEVLAQRWRTPGGEIDLVVRIGGVIAFAEVKARSRPGADSPVSRRQWARIAAAAEAWIAAHPEPAAGHRFDAVLVDGQGRAVILEDAHRPGSD